MGRGESGRCPRGHRPQGGAGATTGACGELGGAAGALGHIRVYPHLNALT